MPGSRYERPSIVPLVIRRTEAPNKSVPADNTTWKMRCGHRADKGGPLMNDKTAILAVELLACAAVPPAKVTFCVRGVSGESGFRRGGRHARPKRGTKGSANGDEIVADHGSKNP
jgi:hypothetical protein